MPKPLAPKGSILLSSYATEIIPTDILDPTDLRSIQHGLFGEVGTIMSTAKKHTREKALFPEHRMAAEEEFGDALWYLAALCRRSGVALSAVFQHATNDPRRDLALAASDLSAGAVATIAIPQEAPELDSALAELGLATAQLLANKPTAEALSAFARHYLDALHATGLTFSDVVQKNLWKARRAFVEPLPEDLIDFDTASNALDEERLPDRFEIRIDERASGKSYLQWKGVFIGDPLTDNIADPDGYRFHDVFHFANAAVLHWSPVMRALIKHKRKNNPKTDEEQDGGRATVVEEGLTAWLFARAKAVDFYEGQDRVPFSTLKVIEQFVAGYEVEQCPLKLWEKSILQGFEVFRQVRQAKGGWVIGDRASRTLRYLPLNART